MYASQFFTDWAIFMQAACCEGFGNLAEQVDHDTGGCCPSEEFYEAEEKVRQTLYKESQARQKEEELKAGWDLKVGRGRNLVFLW